MLDLSGLNPPQREAVLTIEGPLLVLAGAGTGKTRVVVHRIAHLLDQGVTPEHILAVTFTNKAAREMRERVADMVSEEAADALTISTFHSFCLRLLRRHIHHLGYGRQFAIAGEGYQRGLVRTIMTELGLTGTGRDPGLWLALISKAKSAVQTPADVRAREDWPRAGEIAEVYEAYQTRMRLMDQVDFDDLLMLTLQLWEKCPDILERHRERFRYLMIDEYQDTNAVQFRLVATLAGSRANLCVVGDDDQSIYGWRGADVGNILDFDSHFSGAKVVRLEQNYRSTTTILQAANAVIANNTQRHAKSLWSAIPAGEKIWEVRAVDEEEEAKFVADYIGERQVRDGVALQDIAILFRSNHQSRALENAFRQANIPYTLVGSNSFYQRKEILDAVSLLQVVNNPRDSMSLLRVLNVPPRGVGDVSLARLKEVGALLGRPLQSLLGHDEFTDRLTGKAKGAVASFDAAIAAARKDFSTPGGLAGKVERFFAEVGYLEGLGKMYKPREDALKRRENVFELLNAIGEFERREGASCTLAEFLESFALLDAQDKESAKGGEEAAVTMMTVHASKGLEFPLVILVGMERGLFPHRNSLEENGEAEERRLFYVAITRAKRELVMTYAEKRRVRGQQVRQRPSPFLDEIPEELVEIKSVATAFAPVSRDVLNDYFSQMKAMFDDDDDDE